MTRLNRPNTSLCFSGFYFEEGAIVSYWSSEVVVKGLNQVDQFELNFILSYDVPKAVPMYGIKRIFKVCKFHIYLSLSLYALFYDVA